MLLFCIIVWILRLGYPAGPLNCEKIREAKLAILKSAQSEIKEFIKSRSLQQTNCELLHSTAREINVLPDNTEFPMNLHMTLVQTRERYLSERSSYDLGSF